MTRRRAAALLLFGGLLAAASFAPATAQTAGGDDGTPPAVDTSGAVAQGSARAGLIEFQLLGILPALPGGLPEVELPYALAELQPYGSSALATPIWPGSVAGDPGSAIGLASGPIVSQFGPFAPAASAVLEQLSTVLKYPVRALAAYPPSPATPPSSKLGVEPAGSILAGGTMSASADEAGAAGSAAFGESLIGGGVQIPALPGIPAPPAGGQDPAILRVRGLGAASFVRNGDKLTAAASAAAGEIDVLGGLIHLEGVKSDASSESDGRKGASRARTTIGKATIFGQEVVFDDQGFRLAGQGGGSPKPLQDALGAAGVADIRLLEGTVEQPADRPSSSTAVADTLQVRMRVPVPLLPDLLASSLGLVPIGALPVSLPIPLGLPREVEVLVRIGGVQASTDLSAASFDDAVSLDSFGDVGSVGGGGFDIGTGTGDVGPLPGAAITGNGGGGTDTAGDVALGLLPAAVRRWGLGGGVLLAGLGGLVLLALFLTYARWQLLAPLPGKAGFKE